jgi:eukaryotic-like serine/threonine-protein kinase
LRQRGERLGPYEILDLIGKGAMGEVYRARDTRLGREVALKTLPPERSNDAVAWARLRAEAQAVAALNHPHIVAVLDVGEEQGAPYVVMELVEGRTLRDALAEGGLPLRHALDLAQQMAGALAAAHERGIVHRDLKPENVVLTPDGQVKILDFGLAKARQPLAGSSLDSTAGGPPRPITEPGLAMGTVGYMSPEQVRGAPADHRSDQFAFGAILHEMIGGKRAFARATPADTLAATLRESPETPAALQDEAVIPLRWLLERCLAKDAQQRYHSTRDLALDLARARESLASSDRGVSARLQVVPAASRRFRLYAAAIVAVILVVVLLWTRRAPQPVFEQITFGRGTVWAGRYAPDSEALIYSAAWDGGPFRLYRKDPHVHESLLLPIPPPASILAMSRANEMALATELRGVLPGRLLGTLSVSATTGGAAREVLGGVRGADYAANGELAVVQCRSGRCTLDYPLGTRLYETEGWLTGPRVSPDGSQVALIEHPMPLDDMGSVVLVDRAGRRRVLGGAWVSTNGLAWGPSGTEIWLAGSQRGALCALHAVSLSGATRSLAHVPGGLALLDVSARGEALMARETRRIGLVASRPEGDGTRDLSVFDASVLADLSDDGRAILSTEIGEGGGSGHSVYLRRDPTSPAVRLGDGLALALSPDGGYALALIPGAHSELIAYPTRTGAALHIAQPSFGECHGASFFPDGRHLVVARSQPNRGLRLFVQDFPDGVPRPLGSECVLLSHLQGFPISPDGKWIAAVGLDERLALYSAKDGKASQLPLLPPGFVPSRWLDDGRSLLVYRMDQQPLRVLRVDLPRGETRPFLEIRAPETNGIQGFPSVRFAADGRGYAYSYAQFLDDLYVVKGID